MTYGELIAWTKRHPGMARVPDDLCMEILNDVYYDICMRVPEVASLVRTYAAETGPKFYNLVAGQMEYPIVYTSGLLTLPDKISQVFGAYLSNSALGTVLALNATTIDEISNYSADWLLDAAATPSRFLVAYTQAVSGDYGTVGIVLNPKPSVAIVGTGAGQYNRLNIITSSPVNAQSETDILTTDTVPQILEPGTALEFGLAYRLARFVSPEMVPKYKMAYEDAVETLKFTMATFTDRLLSNFQNPRSN